MAEENRAPKSRVGMNEMAGTLSGGNRTAGVIIAICMIALGILFLVWPVRTDIVVMYIATIGFILYGVYQIVVYVTTPSDHKSGWVLANGIIFTILGILILASGPIDMLLTFAFLLGFLALFGGIMQVSAYISLRRAKAAGAAWVLVSGVINLVLGVFFIIAPFAAVWAIAYVLGIYLIIGGAALFAEAVSGHHGRRY